MILPPPITEPVIPMVAEAVDPPPHPMNPEPVMQPTEFEVINPAGERDVGRKRAASEQQSLECGGNRC
ncbi:hypothetical protein M3Y99_01904500 [Aphelenchoides fujianensis]|nr:hypothetical protein M3Y99_01904500 [Aphelenchoides fujianensis]